MQSIVRAVRGMARHLKYLERDMASHVAMKPQSSAPQAALATKCIRNMSLLTERIASYSLSSEAATYRVLEKTL